MKRIIEEYGLIVVLILVIFLVWGFAVPTYKIVAEDIQVVANKITDSMDGETGAEKDLVGEAYALMLYDQEGAGYKHMYFVRSENPISVGDTYNGMKVEAVYTGFETTDYCYSEGIKPDWLNYEYMDYLVSVTVVDEIRPISTSGWFAGFNYCENYDLTKLNTSNVTDMSYMFYGILPAPTSLSLSATNDVSGFYVVGIEDWDVSSVTNMSNMFGNAGYNATSWNIGDISSWNVSNVTSMIYMFTDAGYRADYTLDLSAWSDKVGKIKYYTCFNYGVETKVIAPTWVN